MYGSPRSLWRIICGAVSTLIVGTATVGALTPIRPRIRPGHPDTLDVQLATITTDTGAFAPGHRDFTRYDLPGLCLSAAITARETFERSLASQLLGDTLAIDTVGLGAVAPVARACGARFTPTNIAPTSMLDLFSLALYEQNDALAQAVADTILTRSRDPDFVTNEYVTTLQAYVQFGRLAAARALVARIDARGPTERALQVRLHDQLRSMYMQQNSDSAWLFLAHEDSLLIQQGVQQHGTANGYAGVLHSYLDLMRHAILRHDTTAIAALARTAQADLGQFSLQEQDLTKPLYPWHRAAWRTLARDTVISKLSPLWYVSSHYGARPLAPPLQADFVWPALGDRAGPMVIPVAGKVNLICGGGVLTNKPFGGIGVIDMYDAYQQAANLRRWIAQYGPAGLVVTVVRAAEGAPAVRFKPQLLSRLYAIVQDSVDEAAFWQWYDQTYPALPVIEAVKVIHTTQWLPPPDRRRLTVSEGAPNGYFNLLSNVSEVGNFFLRGEENTCALIGRDGRLLYKPDERSLWDPGWDDVLQWLFTTSNGAPRSSLLPGVHP